jgi:HTH-type transcriptional regulator/antitoxin HipB
MQIKSIRDMAATVRGRRIDLGLSQGKLATRAGVSRLWINQFEAGKPTAEFGLVLRLLDALDLRLDIAPGDQGRENSARGAVDLDDLLDQYHVR